MPVAFFPAMARLAAGLFSCLKLSWIRFLLKKSAKRFFSWPYLEKLGKKK